MKSAIIVIIILIITIISLVYFTNDDLNYGISLIDSDIPEGTNARLIYEINNGWFSSDKTGVNMFYYITSEGKNTEQVLNFETISSRESENGATSIPTSHLPPGVYTVRTDLEYYELGKGRVKFLTLELTIYEE